MKVSRSRQLNESGFTLIEMIGVLAVIAVLAALIIPKVFDVIAQSKVDGFASAVHTYESAITKYYADVGTILPLNVAGTPQTENSGDSANPRSLPARLALSSSDPLVLTTNLWPKFAGPYLEKFSTNSPPQLGTAMYIPVQGAVAYGTAVTGNNRGWDLKGDDGNSDLPTNSNVAYLRVTGISEEDFLALDKIFDRDIGTTINQKELRGRAKWVSSSNGTLYLYLTHR